MITIEKVKAKVAELENRRSTVKEEMKIIPLTGEYAKLLEKRIEIFNCQIGVLNELLGEG